VALAVVTSCSSSSYLEDLAEPTVHWEHSNGLCSFVRAVDGRGTVWDDSGCEDGRFTLEKVGSAGGERHANLLRAVRALPMPSPKRPECRTGTDHSFGLWQEGKSTVWFACGESRQFRDLTGLDEPFRSIATMMNDLVGSTR
jgi:hypothetical protein